MMQYLSPSTRLTRAALLAGVALSALGATMLLGGCGGGAGGANTVTRVFTYRGAGESFTVPAGVTSIKVKMWGAGGGQNGGSGAFVSGDLAVTPGEKIGILVGQGGQVKLNGTTERAFSGGGSGNGDTVWAGGGGGGFTAILAPSTLEDFPGNMTAVGSGGGGQFYSGGAGGITTGQKGSGDTGGGAPGTQTAGGAAGGGTATGTAGGQTTAGNGGPTSGGGGAGYYGGAGGGKNGLNGGGGGGSSKIDRLTNVATKAGKFHPDAGSTTITILPGGADDPDYVAGIGVGGKNNEAGGHGYVVFSYKQ